MTWATAALAVILLALVPAGRAVSADSRAADGDLVRNVSVRHEIDFGHSVNIELEADVQGSITEVRAVFAPIGPRTVSSYTYPRFDVPANGGRLTATFSIDTGGSDYVPPGTEFELFFELTMSDGSVNETAPERILYIDPGKDWRVLSEPGIPLDFYYYGFSDSAAAGLASRVSASWQDIAGTIGLEDDSVQRFRAIIYPDVRELNAVFPPTSAAASDGVFFGGFAMERYGVFVLGGPSANSVVHELTHLLVDTRVNSLLSPGVPSWLHEGLAQFFEAGSSSNYTSQLGPAAADDRLLVLHNRNTVPARGSEIGLYYTQVGSFVGQLLEDNGPELMAETLGLINEGSTAAEAVETAYGKPLWQLESEWRTRLGASELQPPVEPAVTAGPATATPETTSQSTPTVPANGQDGEAPEDGSAGFNWTGPLIGAILAVIVFAVWSFIVSRRRFGSRR